VGSSKEPQTILEDSCNAFYDELKSRSKNNAD
jgi:hypothetical protein